MRVLLQNTETNLYFVDAEQWTDDPVKATDFEDVEQAARAYHTQNLAYARIVIDSFSAGVRPPPVSRVARQIRASGC